MPCNMGDICRRVQRCDSLYLWKVSGGGNHGSTAKGVANQEHGSLIIGTKIISGLNKITHIHGKIR